MKTTIYLAIFVTVAAYAVPSQAELIAWDSFAMDAGGNDYDIGSLQNQNPSVGLDGFRGAWNGGTAAVVAVSGGLTHALSPGTPLEGRIAPFTSDIGFANRRLSRAIDYTPTDGTYFMSALLRKEHATNGDLVVGLAPLESANWSFSSLKGTYIGFERGSIDFLAANTLHTLVPANAVNIGETYFAVMQYEYSTSAPDSITATVYDGSSTEIANHTFTGLALDGNIGRLGFLVSDLPPTVFIDEWRFGTELADVMFVPPNGDYDDDGDVDGADFLGWQRGESPDPLSQTDLAAWEEHYGTVASLTARSAAVPEPASALLMATAVLFFSIKAPSMDESNGAWLRARVGRARTEPGFRLHAMSTS
jgi:hypothetical protein